MEGPLYFLLQQWRSVFCGVLLYHQPRKNTIREARSVDTQFKSEFLKEQFTST